MYYHRLSFNESWINHIPQNTMLQNKIYQNFIKEIIKTFLVILIGLSMIAWTVRAVNFLDLIVENGYSISTYFQYSFLNIFGILTKLIPLSFLIALLIFILKQFKENEFIILWTSGVKKLKIVNLFFVISVFILFFYLLFATFLTPLALNKSRNLLNNSSFNSFLPTIRVQQFSDSFKGFTFLVENKIDNRINNIFIHDSSNVLKNLTANQSTDSSTTIVAKEGFVEEKKLILFNGQIMKTKKNIDKNSIIKFEQLAIDLDNLQADTISMPKLQERPSKELFKCILIFANDKIVCPEKAKNEMTSVLSRRFVLPFYIPVISLICSFLLIKNNKKNIIFNKFGIFLMSFLILLYSELIIRYTGISKTLAGVFLISPFILIPIIYLFLIFKFSRESVTR